MNNIYYVKETVIIILPIIEEYKENYVIDHWIYGLIKYKKPLSKGFFTSKEEALNQLKRNLEKRIKSTQNSLTKLMAKLDSIEDGEEAMKDMGIFNVR